MKSKLPIPIVIAIVALAIIAAVTAFVMIIKLPAPVTSSVAVIIPKATPLVEANPLKIKYEDSIMMDMNSNSEQTFALINKTVWSWGVPEDGIKKPYYYSPEKFLENVLKIYQGYYCMYAIKTDGSLWGWGSNDKGQLFNDKKEGSPIPVLIQKEIKEFTVKVVSESYDYSNIKIITVNGNIKIFGLHKADEKYNKILINLKKTYFTESNLYNNVLLMNDDSLWIQKDKKLIKLLSDVKSFQMNRVGLVIRKDGSLWSFGENIDGALGIGLKSNRESVINFSIKPHKILDNVKSVGIFDEHQWIYSCYAIKKDNTLWMWGYDRIVLGRMGLDCTTPKKVLNNVKDLKGNPTGCAFALKTDASLWVWGLSKVDDYQGNYFEKYIKYSKVMDGVSDIQGDGYYPTSMQIYKTDGSIWTLSERIKPVRVTNFLDSFGYELNDVSYFLKKDRSLWTWDKKKKIIEDVKQFFDFGSTFYAIKNDGTVWGWGEPYVGDGTNKTRNKPVQIKFDGK